MPSPPPVLDRYLPAHFTQLRGPGYWLAAPATQAVRDASGYACVSIGHVAGALPSPARLFEQLSRRDWRSLPDGHYSVAAIAPNKRAVLLRGLTGGEHLYYRQIDDTLWFSNSLRCLLVHPEIERKLDRTSLPQLLATGMTWGGDRSMVAGVCEVKPGKALTWQNGNFGTRWFWDGLLQAPEGSPEQLGRDFRERLTAAVVAGVPGPGPVAVSLSGGIDSAAVACAAVDAFGADRVVAYTYEFDDAGHSNETAYARAVCKHLGIRKHRVHALKLDSFLSRIPETVWRAERFVHWPKAFMLLAAERVRDDGFDRVLSGFGIGSHMGTLSALGAALSGARTRALLPWYWRMATRRRFQWLGRMEWCHPALAPPSLRLLPLLALAYPPTAVSGGTHDEPAFLRRAPWLPSSLKRMLETWHTGLAWDRDFVDLPLPQRLVHQSFSHLVSCIDVTRWEQPLREIGLLRLSPAHYASVLPYAYLPYNPGPPRWSAERMLRPGKHLLRIGFAGDIPESVRTRRKHWGDAVISPAWLRAGVQWMRSAVGETAVDALGLGPEAARAARHWDPRSPQSTLTALAMWHAVVLRRDGPSAPDWYELLSAQHRASERPSGLLEPQY